MDEAVPVIGDDGLGAGVKGVANMRGRPPAHGLKARGHLGIGIPHFAQDGFIIFQKLERQPARRIHALQQSGPFNDALQLQQGRVQIRSI